MLCYFYHKVKRKIYHPRWRTRSSWRAIGCRHFSMDHSCANVLRLACTVALHVIFNSQLTSILVSLFEATMSRYKENVASILHLAIPNLLWIFSKLYAFRSSPRFKGGLCRQNCLWSYFFGPAGRKYKSCQHFYRSICRQEILFMIKKKLQVGHLLGRLLEIFLSSWKWHCSGVVIT